MITNFLRVALRSFLRQRLYSFINILGLTSGLTCTLLIFLWVRDEMVKDKFHENADSIFRVVSNLDLGDGKMTTWTITPGPLSDDIRDAIPGIDRMARTMDIGPQLVRYEDRNFLEGGLFADPDFFRIFSFRISRGTIPARNLDKSWVVISRNVADKLFAHDEALGKSITVGEREVLVTAVFENIGPESSLQFDFILPFEIQRERRGKGFTWGNFDYPLYLKLTNPSQSAEVIAAINKRASGREETKDIRFYIQPFTESYLNAHFENGVPTGGRIQYVRLFSIVALFILIIASINFMNMATARAATRMKEVGVRKVVGAQRLSLVLQFISESLVITFLSMALAIGIVYACLPLFNLLVAKRMALDLLDPVLALSILAIALLTGVMAGAYPAFFLSSYRPASVLKGTLPSTYTGTSLRKMLVVFQFTLTVIMVASALIVYRQIEFIRNTNIGYDREAILSFSARDSENSNYDVFRNELLQHPGIKLVTRSNSSLVQVNNQNGSVRWPGKADQDAQLFRTVVVDFDFLETMGLTLKQGRFFSRAFNDTTNFILSQRAVDAMGLTEPLGQKISQWGNDGVVVGVIDDFHSRSMHEAIDPIVFLCKPSWTWWVFVKVDPRQQQSAIAHIQRLHRKYAPGFPFEYSFLDDDFENLYNNEKVTSTLAIGFTTMAIIISGLGLLGLASYTTERKRKEISIRKTLGASVAVLVAGISKDFVKLSVWSAVIGCPIAYYLMDRFLDSYAYHTELRWETFAQTAGLVLVVSLVTVIFQVTKAAVANPVEALRQE